MNANGRSGSVTTLNPPENVEAERAVLGGVLVDPEVIHRVGWLRERHFNREAHRGIWKALKSLKRDDIGIDLVSLCNRISEMGLLDSVGGESYIGALIEATPTAAGIEAHAGIVRDKAMLREMVTAATEVRARALENPEDSAELAERAERLFFSIGQERHSGKSGFRHVNEVLDGVWGDLEEAYEGRPRRLGIPTGIRALDEKTGGLHPEQMIVIGGATSQGKTALAVRLTLNIARRKNCVAYFSLEMSDDEIMARMLSMESGVPLMTVRIGKPSNDEFSELTKAAGRIGEMPIFMNEAVHVSPREIVSVCRRLKSKEGLDVVLVDYLQLLQPSKRTDNRYQEVSETSRAMKLIAKELKVPVIVLSQLSREVSRREDHTPRPSDLRDSGSIEQDSDVILFVHRQQEYEKRPSTEWEAVRGSADLIIAKQRNGPTDTIPMRFYHETADFSEVDCQEKMGIEIR